ncbi:MAG: DNA replication/repair protein RecF [Rudaea sp.]|nr:DNA replication/repair protein RecF [Rudaea sp.]
MRLIELRLENLRNISSLELQLDPRINLFIGSNGAGKTSILEGAYLLSHAQSFRSGQINALIGRGAEHFSVFARVERHAGPVQIGLTRAAGSWSAKVNNDDASSLGRMLREYAQVCFEPGTHALISGGSEERRRFLDWGAFHVEPEFMARVRAFRRALLQRNTLLKQGCRDLELDWWDKEVARAGESLSTSRSDYFHRYSPALIEAMACYLPELGEASTRYSQGWPEDMSLEQALKETRGSDQARGFTSRGPHRTDWGIQFALAPQREHLSRGQEKLCALACVLAQARCFADSRGEWPVIALDDLSSELDVAHQGIVVDTLSSCGAQILISAIDIPACIRAAGVPARVFHVEHGKVRTLL